MIKFKLFLNETAVPGRGVIAASGREMERHQQKYVTPFLGKKEFSHTLASDNGNMKAGTKVKLNKAVTSVNNFIEEVFNLDGSHKTQTHNPNPSAFNCRFCPFKDNKELCDKGLT